MVKLIENDEFDEIIKLIYRYEGLVLKEEDKSTKMREMYFTIYMEKEMFQEAEEELKILGKSNYEFYEKAKLMLEFKIKENKSFKLEGDRLRAFEWEKFDEVYEMLNKQKYLAIKDEEYIQGLELETKEAEYKSLDKKREEALEYSDYQKAYLLLEKQEKLNVKFISEIEQIKDSMEELKKEVLEEYHEMTTKTLRHQMRKAARNKDYDYFEFFPNIWAFKDEFKMTPIHYMALEGDVIGLGKTYESSGNLIMDENVFGHNILDLLGLSCDPRFGDNGEALIDLLKEIRYLIEGDIIYNRIEFLKTGLGDDILSYNISKEFLDRIDYKERKRLIDVRMEELNSRLISSNHFKELKFNLMDLETAEGFL